MSLPVFCLLFLSQFIDIVKGKGADECITLRCSEDGPEIRFPFQIMPGHPKLCGYPGFDISCSKDNQTLLALSPMVKVQVNKIDYKHQLVYIYDPDGCLGTELSLLDMSSSPFQVGGYTDNFTIFNCSAADRYADDMYQFEIPRLRSSEHKVYVVSPDAPLYYLSLSSCIKMHTFSPIPYDVITNQEVQYSLSWSYPSCKKCEKQGKNCRAKDGIEREIECYTAPLQGRDELQSLLVTGVLVGVLLLVIIVLTVRHLRGSKKKESELQRFLEDYKALKPTRYSYSDIKRITNQFKHKLGQGGYGSVFKGYISSEISVAVKMLENIKGNGEDFINEVATIGRIHHVNVVCLVGFCVDGVKRALVYEYLPNGSLDRFTNPRNNENQTLGFDKLQDIAVGIARGIEYLHQGCDHRILHFDIKPHNILLDEAFNPKVSDFGLAKLCPREKSAVSMTWARGTPGYITPEVFSRNFGNISLKSDIYSFGMLLLDMVGARKNDNVTAGSASQMYFPDWIYDNLNQAENDSNEIANRLTITGLWCIQWYPVDRPSMKSVIQMLEGHVDGLRVPPKPFPYQDPVGTQMTTYTGSWSSQVTTIYELEESQ